MKKEGEKEQEEGAREQKQGAQRRVCNGGGVEVRRQMEARGAGRLLLYTVRHAGRTDVPATEAG